MNNEAVLRGQMKPVTCATLAEADFLSQVVDLAHLCGWKVHHSRPARTAKGWCTPIQGDAGFPDLVLCRPPYIILAELKSETGKLSPAQQDWVAALEVSTSADVRVWRPSDWDEIVRVLR